MTFRVYEWRIGRYRYDKGLFYNLVRYRDSKCPYDDGVGYIPPPERRTIENIKSIRIMFVTSLIIIFMFILVGVLQRLFA